VQVLQPKLNIDREDVIRWLNKIPEPELAKTPVQLLATIYLIEKIRDLLNRLTVRVVRA